MQFKFFAIPVCSPEQDEEELNKFLRSHRVLTVERHFNPEKAYWAVAVEYADQNPTAEAPPLHRREKTDFTIGMTEEEKERFEKYKNTRRRLATERGVPAYLIFTNDELSILAHVPVLNAETVRNVKGIAPSRLNDYVAFFFNSTEDEKSGLPDAVHLQSGKPA